MLALVRYSAVAVGFVFGCGRIAFDHDGSGLSPHLEITPPVTLSDPGTLGGCPVIVWNGDGWTVAWSDARDHDTYFVRLDAGGVKQGGIVRVSNLSNLGSCPSLVWTGSEYLFEIAHQVCTDSFIDAYRFDARGALLGSVASVSTPVNTWLTWSIGWNGSGFHLTWNESTLRFAQLDPTGRPIGTDFQLSTSAALYSTVIGTPPGSVAVWSEDMEVRFATLAAGAVAYKMPIAATGSISQPVGAAWTGSELGLAWLTDPFHLWFAVADPATGETTDPDETTETIGQVRPLVASYPSGFGMVLTYPMAVPSLVFALRDASGAKVGNATPLADTGTSPAFTFGGDRFAVVYVVDKQIQLVFVKP